jgi:hypothetical protein
LILGNNKVANVAINNNPKTMDRFNRKAQRKIFEKNIAK